MLSETTFIQVGATQFHSFATSSETPPKQNPEYLP